MDKTAKCVKCENVIETTMSGIPAKEAPNGVRFNGGYNFGSSLYDWGVDGISVHLVICDNCIKQLVSNGLVWEEHDPRFLEKRKNYERKT